jgi:hypothetical protein
VPKQSSILWTSTIPVEAPGRPPTRFYRVPEQSSILWAGDHICLRSSTAERRSFKPKRVGSAPTGGTIYPEDLAHSPHRRWKGCQLCKPWKFKDNGQAARKTVGELRQIGRSRRVSRHGIYDA